MSSRAASTASARHVWRRFRRNGRGSAAVEFALVAPVFFALLFAIIETGVMFFASQQLETITQESARMILTGQAQTASYTEAQFQNYVCSQVPVPALFTCGNIYVDVKSYPSATGTSCSTFSNVVINNQIDSSGNFINNMQYSPGGPRRYRYREAVLSMAAVRHRAWLQHREFVGQQAIAGGHGCILQ
jgi:Flp pilus assembly protein TadG